MDDQLPPSGGLAASTADGEPATTFRPVTMEEWPDLEALFREPGPQNGCWCMYWRVRRSDFHLGYGEGNWQALCALVAAGRVPGILAYREGRAIAWCSVAPREEFPVLDRSRTLKRVDDRPVWSITCFFVSQRYRRQGMTEQLLRAALGYAREQGAQTVEAYPLRTEMADSQPYEQYMGIRSTFERLGFRTVAQESGRRPIMRYDL